MNRMMNAVVAPNPTIHIVHTAPVKKKELDERTRKIRRLLRLLGASRLRASQMAYLARLMEEFEGELQEILAENSNYEPPCVCAVSRRPAEVIRGHFGKPRRKTRDPDEVQTDHLVRNASGLGVRIKKRRIGFDI